MGLSFQEKSLWLVMTSLVAAFAFYFTLALKVVTPDVNPAQAGLFVAAVVLLVIAQVVGHLLIVIVDRRDDTDERDRIIALEGGRVGGFVLATGVFLALCTAVAVPGNFATAHVLLASWVVAQVAEIGVQLWHYRRGV
jgi:hypothetical protein